MLILLVSVLVGRSRDALLAAIAFWAVAIVLLPRVAPDVASAAVPLRDRLQTDVASSATCAGWRHPQPGRPALRRLQGGNAALLRGDPGRGSAGQLQGRAGHGERLTSQLFDRYSGNSHAAQARQSTAIEAAGVLSPAMALRSTSMAAAGSHFAGHRRSLERAEAYRCALV